MVTFAEEPTIDTYHIEVAGEEKIKEHLAKPHNWVSQRHETLPEIPPNTAFLCSPADVPGPHRVQLHDKDITTDIRQKFKELCEEEELYEEKPFPKTMRTSTELSLSRWTLTQETVHL